jgi:hypothetical protein
MRLSRIITALLAGLAVAAAPSAALAAQSAPAPSYPPGAPNLTVEPAGTVTLGTVLRLEGHRFGAREIVDISVSRVPLAAGVRGAPARRSTGSTVAMVPVAHQLPSQLQPITLTATTGPDGEFEVSFRPTDVGVFTFVATGRTTGRTASVTVTVIEGKPLPVTGSNVGPEVAVGTGLLSVGVLVLMLTMAWRRRSRRRGESELETVH